MKKIISLLLAGGMIVTLAACRNTAENTAATAIDAAAAQSPAAEVKAGEAQTAETERAAGEAGTPDAETPAAETAGLANPMREITDKADFDKELGIPIDADLLYSEAKLFIIDGRIAELQFSFDNIMGEKVNCCLRATKDPEAAGNLSGIYDSTLKEVSDFDYTSAKGDFTITLSTNDSGSISVYSWQLGDVWYSLSLQGEPSGMELAEVLDSVMLAAVGETQSFAAAEEEAAQANAEEASWYELNDDATVLTVRLRANATTGYEWSCKIRDPASLEEITSEYIEDAHPNGMAGVGGTWTASFRVPGGIDTNGVLGRQNDIRFTYARSWEGEGIPSKTLDLLIHDTEMEILEVHEPDFENAEKAEDGEYPVTLSFADMQEENALSFYALAGIPETVTLADEEVKALKTGDIIPLSQYDLYDIEVTKLEKVNDDTIRINEEERLQYDGTRKAWVIVGWDDDICSRTVEKRLVHFTNETVIEDGMEEILQTGNSGTIYDKMKTYWYVNADLTVKDGEAKKLRIHYHP